jgi:hypothetical protein
LGAVRSVIEVREFLPKEIKQLIDQIPLTCHPIISGLVLGIGGDKCGPAGRNIPDTILEFLVPDDFVTVSGTARFGPSCVIHDQCYDRCDGRKKQCDDEFLVNLEAECSRKFSGITVDCCKMTASIYHDIVRGSGGKKAYRAACPNADL